MTFPPQADAADRALLERAAGDFAGVQMNAATLAEIAATRGMDLATALLYTRVRSANEGIVTAIEGGISDAHPEPVRIVVMPGAFHRHHRDTGADGARLFDAARDLGWPRPGVVDVSSLGSQAANAAALLQHLKVSEDRRMIVVSLSKGSADVAAALRNARAAEAFSRVFSWVNLSGLVFGTPLIDWLRRRPLRTAGVHVLLWSKALRFSPLDELRHAPNSNMKMPNHLRAIHVLGFPLRRHLRHRWADEGYARLSPLGPNDGGGILLADALRLPGTIVPVWGADHYLNPAWDFSDLLRNVLLHAARSQSEPKTKPAARSSA